ncbi:MAG: glycosyltransferase family 4 protein [Proteobacteria bacterium]|nr:glycosyltransferase family 4 protein [Pseudomonadota bacterium]
MKISSNHREDRKICFVAAIELTIRVFMVEHIKRLSRENRVTVVVNTDNVDFLMAYGLDVKVVPVKIKRRPSPFSDIIALFKLYMLFREEGFYAVHSITPKAGLISMLAAFLANIPLRIHTFTGQVWATKKGIKRGILKNMDRLLALCTTHILTDSKSQQDFIVKEGIVLPGKSFIIGNGSICGVDSIRFRPDQGARMLLREQLLIPESDILFLFLGRLTFDKGLLDLARAFSKLCGSVKNTHLLIVGPDEEGMKDRVISKCSNCIDKIHFYDFTDAPEKFMAASDVFCLPSYREGFGIAVIEAGSAGIPSIGTRIYGVIDSIEENVTGYLYEPGDIDGLFEEMRKIIDEPEVRMEMGRLARERAISLFSKEYVADAFFAFYNCILVKSKDKRDICETDS